MLKKYFSIKKDHKVKIFTTYLQYPKMNDSDDVIIIYNFMELLNNEYFMYSDFIIYHFGVYYELFDSIVVAGKFKIRKPKIIIKFHNITPETTADYEYNQIREKSFSQMTNLFYADEIWSDGKISKIDLIEYSIEEKKIKILPVPIQFCESKYCMDVNEIIQIKKKKKHSKIIMDSDEVQFLFVGRFVKAKGVLDLIEAIHKVVLYGIKSLKLYLIGATVFSDKEYVKSIQKYITDNSLNNYIKFVGEVSRDTLSDYFMLSDCFVMPSYHEGQCVPIVEAFSYGCNVISYDNSNLPYVASGFATLVKTGNIRLLSEAIIDMYKRLNNRFEETMILVNENEVSRKSYIKKVIQYSNNYSFETVKNQLISYLGI